MSYNYIEIKGSNEKLPPQQHFLFITRELKKPVKTKENKNFYADSKKIYDEAMKQRTIMFDIFKTGSVDMHDRSIETDDITKRIGNAVCSNVFDEYIIYLIEPLIVSEQSEQHNWQYKYRCHTFNIIKEITSIEELFEHAYTNNYYVEFMADIFSKMRYCNEGYKENALKWFEYAKEKYPYNEKSYPDNRLTLWNMIAECGVPDEEIINRMLDNELILLHHKYDKESSMFKKLVQYTRFDLASKYLNLVQCDYALGNIKSDMVSLTILRSNSDNQFVKEIFKTLGIEDKSIKIKITSYGKYRDEVEEMTFEDINKAKAYIVKNYVVDFDKVAKGIHDIYVCDDLNNEFHIEVAD